MGKAGVVECRGSGTSIAELGVCGIVAVGDVVDVLGVEGLELGEEGRLSVVGEARRRRRRHGLRWAAATRLGRVICLRG